MRYEQHPDGSCTIWLSARDTYNWATRPGHRWPCSRLRNKRVRADFDSHGDLTDYTVDGRDDHDLTADELNACVSDHLAGIDPAHPAIRGEPTPV